MLVIRVSDTLVKRVSLIDVRRAEIEIERVTSTVPALLFVLEETSSTVIEYAGRA